jgi:type IV pilus assembly protein PilO
MKATIQLAIAIVAVGAGIFGYEIYDFQTNEVPKLEQESARLEAQITSKQKELRHLQEFVQNIDKIKQELHEINLQLESALEHMPRGFNLSELLRKLTLLAQNSGVELSSFRPKKTPEKKEGSFYATTQIDFELKGTFPQTLVFMDQLSRLKRIVNIETLELKTSDASAQRSGALVAATTATIKTYRFTE